MELYSFVERFLFFLLPGFSFVFFFCYLTGKDMRSEKLTVVYVLVASTMSYLTGDMILIIINFLLRMNYEIVDVSEVLTGTEKTLSMPAIVIAIIASFLLCILAIWAADRDVAFTLLHKFRITHRIGGGEIWGTLFDEENQIIVRDTITGNTYYGKIVSYSTGALDGKTDDNVLREFKLEDVEVYPNSEDSEKYEMKVVYLCRKPSEITIEIGDYSGRNKTNEKRTKKRTEYRAYSEFSNAPERTNTQKK